MRITDVKKKQKIFMIMLLVAMCFGVTGSSIAVKAAAVQNVEDISDAAKAKKNGFYKENGKYYYYVNGKKKYNYLKKVGKYYYYFGSKGYAIKYTAEIKGKRYLFNEKRRMVRLNRNDFYTVAGRRYYLNKDNTVKTGWFTLSGNRLYYAKSTGEFLRGCTYEGITFNAKTGAAQASMAKEAKIRVMNTLDRITNPGMSDAQKLRAAWNYVVGGRFGYCSIYPNLASPSWCQELTYKMFIYGGGNCYGFACMFAALAKHIGYDSYVVCGRVPGSRDGASDGMTRHAWVRINGANYDPEAQYAGWCRGIYGYGYYPMANQVQRVVRYAG